MEQEPRRAREDPRDRVLSADTTPAEHERRNRDFWDADADDYQAAHGKQLARGAVWGVWAIPESELQVLGEVRGLDVLEYGCGAAHWSSKLAAQGARVVALDQSFAQLRHARRTRDKARVDFTIVCASGETVPLRDGAFDVVFCDHGAMSFCDPERTLAETARLLRPGGLLAFNKSTLLRDLCYDVDAERQTTELRTPYFDSRVFAFPEGTVDFHLTYGEWVRAFRRHGFVIEDLLEPRPGSRATTSYDDYVPRDWASRWPAEEIWKVRRSSRPT